MPETRKLAAIMFTDVVGYTAQMAADERKTLQLLKQKRALLQPLIKRFRGQWLKEVGDGDLSSFQSALDAVHCALALQGALLGKPDLQLRIGIHVGDVVFSAGDVFGDGVNVASRIVSMAEPRGICISERVYEDICNKPDLVVTPLGEPVLKNVSRPIKLYALTAGHAPTPDVALPLPRRARRALSLGALGLLVVVGVAIASRYRTETPSAPVNNAAPVAPTVVAVLPFSVRGSREFEYLGEGMVTLLSTKLDGAGALRRVDPHSLLSFVSRQGGGGIDPERGRAVAAYFGAGLFVLGSILEVPGHLHIEASLYDRQRPEALTQAAVEGDAVEILSLVDNLAAQLLAGRSNAPGARLTRIAALTTHSFPALKAYLEGDSADRAQRYEAAEEAFQRAVAVDPSFALAYYRLADAAAWGDNPDVSHHAVEQASRLSDRLSEHDRLLVTAQFACLRGATEEAERLYQAIVGTYPDDYDAWRWLGETLFHLNPLRGRSIVEARQPFERAFALDPGRTDAPLHLAQIAAIQGRRSELQTRTDQYLALDPSSEWSLRVRAMGAFEAGDHAGQEAVIADLKAASDVAAPRAADYVLYANHITGAAEIAAVTIEPARAAPVRAIGDVQLAHLHLMRGQWGAAKAALTAAAHFDPATVLEYRALLSAAPFLPLPRSEREAVRDEVTRWDAAAVRPSATRAVWFSVHNGLHTSLRTYLLGLLSARLEDPALTAQYATQLEDDQSPQAARAAAHAFAASLRAQAAWLRGDAPSALATLERGRLESWAEYTLASPFFSQAYERYLHAQLLHAVGRDEEALAWYASLGEASLYDRIYLAPSHLRRAEIYERLGDREKARAHYQHFIELWKDCDEALRPTVADAEQRLQRLNEGTLQ